MKRVLCPKCENYLFFDETKYSEGQSLVFECEHCGKQFSIRLGKSKVKALRKEENLEEEAEVHKEEFGYITVIENVFGFKQVLPLQERDAPSLTGTFLMNEILGDKDRVRMEDGAIVTIGATTFILHTAEAE